MDAGAITVRRRFGLAALICAALTVVHLALIVYLDNTNLATTNGLWKSPWIHAWETGTGRPVDTGDLLYLPAYGVLCRLIPDRAVSYGVPAGVPTYRKVAMLNAFFSGLASAAVFWLAFRFTLSIGAAALVALAHSTAGFVLLHSVNSEDVTPAYAFFVIAVALFFEYVTQRKFYLLAACALFLALITFFHWTLMPPAAVALGAAQLYLWRARRLRLWQAGAFVAMLLLMLAAGTLITNWLYPAHPYSVWDVIYPAKAHPDGWSGFSWSKLGYLFIGLGNYLAGGRNLGDSRFLADQNVLRPMLVSWLYCGFCLIVAGAAVIHRRTSVKLRLLAAFGLVLFAAGELEALYVLPHDPQWHMEPMFLSVAALIIASDWVRRRWSRLPAALLSVVVVLAFLMNARSVIEIMAMARGNDSRYVSVVRQLAQLFPPEQVLIVSQGFQDWNTWLYYEINRGDLDLYLSRNLHLTGPFTSHLGISASAAASLVEGRISGALASGRRVVAGSLWGEEPSETVAVLAVLTPAPRARAFHEALVRAFRTGEVWQTPVGKFVELLPLAGRVLELPQKPD